MFGRILIWTLYHPRTKRGPCGLGWRVGQHFATIRSSKDIIRPQTDSGCHVLPNLMILHFLGGGYPIEYILHLK